MAPKSSQIKPKPVEKIAGQRRSSRDRKRKRMPDESPEHPASKKAARLGGSQETPVTLDDADADAEAIQIDTDDEISSMESDPFKDTEGSEEESEEEDAEPEEEAGSADGSGQASEVEAADAPTEETPEEQLRRKQKGWTAGIYTCFKAGDEVTLGYDRDGRLYHQFRCAKNCLHPFVRRYQDGKDASSTSNLLKHARKCFGNETVNAIRDGKAQGPSAASLRDGSITASFKRQGSQLTFGLHNFTAMQNRVEHVKWITSSLRPILIVDDVGYRVLMKTGRPDISIPGRMTLTRDIHALFEIVKKKVATDLQNTPGRHNHATDAWTSSNSKALMADVVTFVKEGKITTLLLDLVEIAKSHTGDTLAKEFSRILDTFGISEKMLAITLDSASNNDAMVARLPTYNPAFAGSASQVRCFGHVLNLIAQAIVKCFDVPAKKKAVAKAKKAQQAQARKAKRGAHDTGDADDEGAEAEDEAEAEDVDGEDDEEVEMTEELEALANEQLTAEMEGLLELADGIELFANDADEDEVPDLLDPEEELQDDDADPGEFEDILKRFEGSEVDVDEYDEDLMELRLLLAKASALRQVAFKIVHSPTKLRPAWAAAIDKVNKDGKLTQRLIPRDVRTRWNSTFDMLDLAVTYQKAIDVVCADRDLGLRKFEISSEEWVVAKYLTKVLEPFKAATLRFSSLKVPTLAHVIPVMDLLDKHIQHYIRSSRTPHSMKKALHLSKTVLDKYYSLTDGSEVYRIVMILFPKYKLKYFKDQGWEQAWIDVAESLVRDEWERTYAGMEVEEAQGSSQVSTSNQPAKDIFSHLDGSPIKQADSRDELARYLSTPVEQVIDPIQWWVARRAEYPRLSRMAIDYLSIPATSTEVERVFSRGRLLLPHTRNRLSADMIRKQLCLYSWTKAGYVDSNDLERVASGPLSDAVKGRPGKGKGKERA